MSTPSLQYVAPTGEAEDQALAPQPVVIYDLPTGGGGDVPTFTELVGSVPSSSGSDLQAILNDIVTRIGVLESA